MGGIEEHSHLWDGSDPDWVLFRLNPDSGEDEARFLILHRKSKHGLIVDDEDLHKEIIERMLRSGVTVLTGPPE